MIDYLMKKKSSQEKAIWEVGLLSCDFLEEKIGEHKMVLLYSKEARKEPLS